MMSSDRPIIYGASNEPFEMPKALDRLLDCVPRTPPPGEYRPSIVHAIVLADIERSKAGRCVFVAKIGDPNFMCDELSLDDAETLSTWAVTSVRIDGDQEMIDVGGVPARFFNVSRGSRMKFGSVRANRSIRVMLRRVWNVRPHFVVTRAAGRWAKIRGRIGLPAPRHRPTRCALVGYTARQR